MPYVDAITRRQVSVLFPDPEAVAELTEGSLNYLLTQILQAWAPKPRYSDINAVIGVLECVKQEYYRRVAVPYENLKLATNGDVYA